MGRSGPKIFSRSAPACNVLPALWNSPSSESVPSCLPKYPNVDAVVALTHAYGCGVAIAAPLAAVPIRTLQNLAKNPNFGGEVMVVGLGCEKLLPERLIPEGAPANIVRMQDEAFHGFGAIIEGIMEMAKARLEVLNSRRRETCPASDLVIGMQCGGSDAFSA